MSLKPMTREKMCSLKAEEDERARIEDEKKRIQTLNTIISQIYTGATNTAKTSTNSSYQHRCDPVMGQNGIFRPGDFYKVNKIDILNRLRDLFPGCTVLYTEAPQSHYHNNPSSIVIDWS